MVDRYIREGCLRKGSKLADAMGNVPCEVFMPDRYVEGLYSDNAFQIPFYEQGQTISAPYTYPLFYRPLKLVEGNKFLEIRAGSGYGAAPAKEMVGEDGKVVTIGINPTSHQFGKENFRKAGYEDILILTSSND